MRPGDLPALKPLLVQLGYDVADADISARFQAVLDNSAHTAWVAVAAGRVIGFLHAFERPALEKPTEVIVQAMVVEKTLRKSGVGARLMVQTERWATDRGHASIALSSQIDPGGRTRFLRPAWLRNRRDIALAAERDLTEAPSLRDFACASPSTKLHANE